MSRRKPVLNIGKSAGSAYGLQTVSAGTGQNIPSVPSDSGAYESGDDLLVCYIDDDTPVVIGRPGYSVGGQYVS